MDNYNNPDKDRDPKSTSSNKESNESIRNYVNQKYVGAKILQRARSTPTSSFQVNRRKSVTFADEVGGELTQSVHYTSETAYFDDFKINYSAQIFETKVRSNSLQSYFSTHNIKNPSKYNFDNFRHVDNLTKSNYYGLHLNHVALKSLIDSHFCISVTIVVQNLSFEKHVNIHYTSDNWKTKHICECSFLCQINPKFDIFTAKINYKQFHPNQNFNINSQICFEFAIEYIVNNERFWDNNNEKNFIVNL